MLSKNTKLNNWTENTGTFSTLGYYSWKNAHQSKQNSIHHWLTRSWKPSLKIKFLSCSMVKCTRHNADNAIRNTQCLIVRLSIRNHLVHHFPWFAVIWWCQTELLYLKISSSTLTLSEHQYSNYFAPIQTTKICMSLTKSNFCFTCYFMALSPARNMALDKGIADISLI